MHKCLFSLVAACLLVGCSDGAAPASPACDVSVSVAPSSPPAPISSPESSATMPNDKPGIQSWSGAKVLTTGDPIGELSIQAALPHPSTFTVQFGVMPPTEPVGNPTYDATAYISWSVEGNTVRRQVSVGNGVSITGAGQNFVVKVKDTSTEDFGFNPYTVTANVVVGSRPSVNQPATLRGFRQAQTILAGGSVVLDIPADAGVISMEASLGAIAAAGLPMLAVVVQKNGAGQIVKQYDPTVLTGFVSVAPNATVVEFYNLGTASFRANITWGIDG